MPFPESPIIAERMTELVACLSDTSPKLARVAVAEAFREGERDDNLLGVAHALVSLRSGS